MATGEQKQKILPAYVPYGTFKNFMETLKKTGLPDRIDKSVMPNLAGGTRGHLISTLKFLGLIGPSGEPGEGLETLSAVGTDEWGGVLKLILDHAYGPVIGDLNLKAASPGQFTRSDFKRTPLWTVRRATRHFGSICRLPRRRPSNFRPTWPR